MWEEGKMVMCALWEDVVCVFMREVRGRREREEGGGERGGKEYLC